jgi:hypothetical protein
MTSTKSTCLTAAFGLVILASLSLAQGRQRQGQQQTTEGNNAAGQFDPRDLSGVWAGGAGDRSISPNVPPMTPEGEMRFKANIPSRPPRGSTSNNTNYKPETSNDPTFACNPRGFPRILYDTNVRIFEIVHLNGRVMQLHQRERTIREFWMDGRELPSAENMENIGPTWMGHSVANWEGDTLVVNTVGLDDRAWLDFFGNPKSFEARVEERYRRVDADTIELRMTLFDPKIYTTPWVSDVKIFRREPRSRLTFFGWYGMLSGVTELTCAPLNANPINKRGG